jgi:hypothetical protein
LGKRAALFAARPWLIGAVPRAGGRWDAGGPLGRRAPKTSNSPPQARFGQTIKRSIAISIPTRQW